MIQQRRLHALLALQWTIISALTAVLVASSFNGEVTGQRIERLIPENGDIWPIHGVSVLGEHRITVLFDVHERAFRCETFEAVPLERGDTVVITVVSTEKDPDDPSCDAPGDFVLEPNTVPMARTVTTRAPARDLQVDDGHDLYVEDSGTTIVEVGS